MSIERPVVLIHGLYMTLRSRGHWGDRAERRGHDLPAPASEVLTEYQELSGPTAEA